MNNENKMQNALLEAIDIMIERKLKKLKFNYYVDAVIQVVHSDTQNSYDILCNGSVYENVPSLHNLTFQVGDVVQVLIKNGDWNKKFIDDKSQHSGM